MSSGAVGVIVAFVVLFYLMPGLALLQLTWRGISEGSRSTRHYLWAAALLVLLWPKAIRDIRRERSHRG